MSKDNILNKIPDTLDFYASNTGKIFDSKGNERPQYKNGDGYCTVNVKTTRGKWVGFGVQRLVMLAHRYPKNTDPKLLTVNHKDRNIENNNLDNLEWLSAKWNNIHASVTDPNPHRPRLYTLKGNEKLLWNNLQECSKGLDIREELLWKALRESSNVNGYTLHHIKSKTHMANALAQTAGKQLNRAPSFSKDVVAFNIHESQYYIYESARQFYTSNHISRKAVAVRLRKRRLSEVDGWLFVYANDKEMLTLLTETVNNINLV